MATTRAYKVKSVPGALVFDPATHGHDTRRAIGHSRVVGAMKKTMFHKDAQPKAAWSKHDDFDTVVDSASGFIRRRITEGSLEYVETIDGFGTKNETRHREAELVRATTAGARRRAAHAAMIAANASAADEANAEALKEADNEAGQVAGASTTGAN